VVVAFGQVGGEAVGGEGEGDGEGVANYVAEGDEAGVLLERGGLLVDVFVLVRRFGVGEWTYRCPVVGWLDDEDGEGVVED